MVFAQSISKSNFRRIDEQIYKIKEEENELKSLSLAAITLIFSITANAVEVTRSYNATLTLKSPRNSLKANQNGFNSYFYEHEAAVLEDASYVRTAFNAKYTIIPRTPTRFSAGAGAVDGRSGFMFQTEAFGGNTSSAAYFGEVASPIYWYESNGAITYPRISHSTAIYNVYAPDGLSIFSYATAQYQYYLDNSKHSVLFGSSTGGIMHNVEHVYDADPSSWLVKGASFFDDLRLDGVVNALTKKTKNELKSSHWLNEKGKNLFVKPGIRATGGNRGSIKTDGTSIHTASPGNLSFDITFGDAEAISLPFAFGDNKDEATLEVFFEDELLGTVFGADYELDELSFLDVDITDYTNMSGALSFVINTTGTESANIFIPESIATSSIASSVVPVPATVWLFSSGLISLIGIARRKKA